MKVSQFDCIVVGGGAAGCVLAARLASGSDRSVALVERGRKDANRWIHVPASFFKALQSQDADVFPPKTIQPSATVRSLSRKARFWAADRRSTA